MVSFERNNLAVLYYLSTYVMGDYCKMIKIIDVLLTF